MQILLCLHVSSRLFSPCLCLFVSVSYYLCLLLSLPSIVSVSYCLCLLLSLSPIVSVSGPRWLTFTWLGCCVLFIYLKKKIVVDINQPSLPTPFYSVLVSFSVSMTVSTVFHCINFPDNSPFSHSVSPRSYFFGPFNYISL